jgi:hypothetical protein
MVISAGAGAPQMTAFARRLHAQLESAQVRHNSKILKIRTSFGLASLAAASASIEDLMKVALQRCRPRGRARPTRSSASPRPRAPPAAVPAAPAAPKPSASSIQTPALNLQPAAPKNDVGRALEMLEKRRSQAAR